MGQTGIVRIGIALLVGTLTGCDLASNILSSPEERINAAFPVSDAARVAEMSALGMANDDQKKELESQFKERLKQRALHCAKGYVPSWHSSMEDVRRAISNKTCFTETDDQIAHWLGMRKVDMLLSQPPLVPIPESAPDTITADGFIQDTRFADKAGVAMVATPQSIEFIDIGAARVISSETRGSMQVGGISPNGRLYVTGDNQGVKIKSVETGGVLYEIKSVLPYQFYWLDDHVAMYGNRNSKAGLIDFLSANEIEIPADTGYLFRAAKMPGEEQRYALFCINEVAVVGLERNNGKASAKILSETPVNAVVWASNTSGPLAGGKSYFATRNELTLVNLENMEVEDVSFVPFYLQTGTATPDPDKILLTGYIQPIQSGDPTGIYLYSISEQTLARVDTEKIFPPRYTYIAPLKKQGIINNNKILLRDELPTLDKVSLTEFVANASAASSRSKEYAYERQVAEQFIRSSGAGAPRPFVPAQPPASAPSRLPPSNNSLLADLARNVQIEGVGVYQGKAGNRSFDSHPMGYVEVRIRPSTKPIVLVLSSYEPVNWKLSPEVGAKVAAVLVSSYYSSNVVGAGAARVIVVGAAHAYQLGGSEYNALNAEVVKYMGKGMDIFQGQYEGGNFSVGGN